MPDVQNDHGVPFHGEQDSIDIEFLPVQQLPNLKRNTSSSGANPQRSGISARDATASRNPWNHRNPASPACRISSHIRISSRSCFARAVVSTRKRMLHTKFLEHLFGWLRSSGLHVLIAMTDAFNRFGEIQPLPLQSGSQNLIERRGGVLPVTLGVVA